MSKPLCRYCGKEMYVEKVEYTDVWYACKCEGDLKEAQLEEEIAALKSELKAKERELSIHKSNSLYEHSIRELENKIKELKRQYME